MSKDDIDRAHYVEQLEAQCMLWTVSEIQRMKELGIKIDESALAIVDDYPFN